MEQYFLLKDYVDEQFKNELSINHEIISDNFQNQILKKLSNKDFIEQLIFLGYIPDLYKSDSSEETLYTKLTEVMVAEWADRMGYQGKYVKQKARYEDVDIITKFGTIVCDAKSFRLGRSQKAPNVKDFVKPEDYRKWLKRHANGIGGLVAYPCLHEWVGKSDAFKYCSSQATPIIMLPYKYLAYLLSIKDNHKIEIEKLWNLSKIFPNEVDNSNDYWNKMNKAIIEATHSTEQELHNFLSEANNLIKKYALFNVSYLNKQKELILSDIEKNINDINDIKILKESYIQYKELKETDFLDKIIKRIKDFRL